MSPAEVSRWAERLRLLGAAVTSSSPVPPFGVELVHSEGTRSAGLDGYGFDPTAADLAAEAARRRAGLWTPPPLDPVRASASVPGPSPLATGRLTLSLEAVK